MTMNEEFEAKLAAFIAKCQEIVDKTYKGTQKLSVMVGKRYVRVVTSNVNVTNSASVYCWVDQTNGDVLKSASWKAPAKHARGNIYGDVSHLSAYGAAYLR